MTTVKEQISELTLPSTMKDVGFNIKPMPEINGVRTHRLERHGVFVAVLYLVPKGNLLRVLKVGDHHYDHLRAIEFLRDHYDVVQLN